MNDVSHRTAWFLAQLKPNAGRIAEKHLKRQKFLTFQPMVDSTRRARGKFVTVKESLFPGYIFVALSREHGDWRKVNSTLGVSRLVSFGEAPASVPDNIVKMLKDRCDDDGKVILNQEFHPGDAVRIGSGPFAEFVATIDRIAPDRRVWVLLDLMGRQTRVAARADQLRAV